MKNDIICTPVSLIMCTESLNNTKIPVAVHLDMSVQVI